MAYEAIVKPQNQYAGLMWWTEVLQVNKRNNQQVSKFSLIKMISGAFRGTPTIDIESLLGVIPFDLSNIDEAIFMVYRIKCTEIWRGPRDMAQSATSNRMILS